MIKKKRILINLLVSINHNLNFRDYEYFVKFDNEYKLHHQAG